MRLFKKLSEKLNNKQKKISAGGMTIPAEINYGAGNNEFLDCLSKKALDLYEKQSDIKNFSRLVLSDPENTSHNDIVSDLVDKGVIIDPFEDEKLEKLADNSRFLRDLGLLD